MGSATTTMYRLTFLLLAAGLLAACGAESTPTDKEAPADPLADSLGGKADFTDRVAVKGDLTFGGEVADKFSEDFEFHGFTFFAAKNDKLTLEVTQRGSSRGLDTALFLYGPAEGVSYRERLGFDDDKGYGKLSRLDDAVVPEDGRYLVVVGTYAGLGRGKYRLTLTCRGNSCGDVPAAQTCPEAVADTVDECVTELIYESDFEAFPYEAFEGCLEDPDYLYELSCDSSWRAPDTFCAAGRDDFVNLTIPACKTELSPRYPTPLPPVSLDALALPDAIQERLDGVNDNCDYCWTDASAYRVTADDVTLEQLSSTFAYGERDHGPNWNIDGEISDASAKSHLDGFDLGADFLTLVTDFAGSEDYIVARNSREFYAAAGAEQWDTMLIFWFDNDVVVTVTLSAGET